ncbi:MAG: hypothetical protein ACREQ5_24745, partial [Candidatus Dormibacteria bacterium]
VEDGGEGVSPAFRCGSLLRAYCMKYRPGPRLLRRDGVTLHGICPAMPLYTASGRRSMKQANRWPRECRARAEQFDWSKIASEVLSEYTAHAA